MHRMLQATGEVCSDQTQVIVWTHDVISINPQVFRVCQFCGNTFVHRQQRLECFREPPERTATLAGTMDLWGTAQRLRRIPGVPSECRCTCPPPDVASTRAKDESPHWLPNQALGRALA